MVMSDIVASVFLVAVLAAAITYIVRAKRAGVKCVGCSVAGSCSSKQASSCECGCSAADKMVADMQQSLR